MTYIDYLNNFNRWIENNHLTLPAQVLYFRLLNVFNRAGWPEWVPVDTIRLQVMTNGLSKPAAYRARDELVKAGFIRYQQGKKGYPSKYELVKAENNGCDSLQNPLQKPLQFPLQNPLQEPLPIYKTKTKTKTKENSPKVNTTTTTNLKTITEQAKKNSLAVVMSAYMDKINPTPSEISISELRFYAEQMGAECCLRAIDIALEKKKYDWFYIKGILSRRLSQGVKCLADWDQLDAEWEEKKREGQQNGSSDNYWTK